MNRNGAQRRPQPTGRARWRRGIGRYRRVLAALCAGIAVAAAVHQLAPPPPATDAVLVAARDLPAGRVLQAADLVTADWPAGSRPDGALASPAGRVLAAPLRRGEPITDTRVTGPGLLAGQPPGTVAVTVRLTDPAATVLLAPGRRIDLLAGAVDARGAAAGSAPGTSPGTRATSDDVLASDVLVLAVPTATADGTGSGSGWLDTTGSLGDPAGGSGGSSGSAGLVVVAVDRDAAARLAAAAGTRTISAALTARP